MANHEQAVRDAAVALKTAITEAQAAGYRVDLPAQAGDLDKVAISETAKVSAAPAPGDEYESMSKTALQELAAARNLEVPGNGTKADLIAALKAGPVAR